LAAAKLIQILGKHLKFFVFCKILILARKEDRKGPLNLFAIIKTSIFGVTYRYCPEMLMTQGKRIGKSRKRNILDDTFGRNSFTLLTGPQ